MNDNATTQGGLMNGRTQMTWSRTLTLAAVLLAGTAGTARASGALLLQQTTPASARGAVAAGPRRIAMDSEVTRLLEQLKDRRRREAELSMVMARLAADTLRGEKGMEQRREVWLRLREASTDLFRVQAQLLALCDGGPRPDGWLGVSFQAQTITYRKQDGSTTVRFVEYPTVGDVADNSPASAAGIQRGDTVLMIGTIDTRGNEISFPSLLKPGAALPLKVRRDGELKHFTVRVTRRPGDWGAECAGVDQLLSAAVRTPLAMPMPGEMTMFTRVAPPPARAPRAATAAPGAPAPAIAPESPEAVEVTTVMVSPRAMAQPGSFYFYETANFFAGAELRRLNADLADLTGVEDGVFVVNVLRGSPADAAGLRSGDVIVRANDAPVVRPDQLGRAMRERDDQSITLTVMRKQKKQTVTIRTSPE